jgi:ribokinase
MPVTSTGDAIAAARALIARGIERVIVTLGADGALLVEASGAHHVPSIAVDAVDTTGAGDAFIGSFIHHLAAGADVGAAIGAGVRYAADSVTKHGTQRSYATKAEFDAFCAARGNG